MSDIERMVAPRHRPDHKCILPMAILLIASWAIVLLVVVSGLTFPLILGRGVFGLLHVPSRFYHDPFAFAIGVGVCWVVRSWFLQLQERMSLNNVCAWLGQAKKPTLQGVVMVILFCSLWIGIIPFLIGLLFELSLVVPSKLWAAEGLACLHFAQDWALGVLILNLWTYLSLLGFIDGIWLVTGRREEGARNAPIRANHYQAGIQVRNNKAWRVTWPRDAFLIQSAVM